MSEERAFLKAIKKKPEDRTARLVYADWLQEHDDPRGELIRIEEELPTLAIYSDRYWQLKPRRRELLKAADKPWLKQMGYGSTDYQPVFADVPSGWKERWRLLREFVERWYQIPMDDVGGKLKPIPKGHPEWRFRKEYVQGVEGVFKKRKLLSSLPPSLREWMLFVRELRLGVTHLTLANGDLDDFGRVRTTPSTTRSAGG
ncbi:MAG: TIGR02996 domain-containing protein [Gemmataceae bacterium]